MYDHWTLHTLILLDIYNVGSYIYIERENDGSLGFMVNNHLTPRVELEDRGGYHKIQFRTNTH